MFQNETRIHPTTTAGIVAIGGTLVEYSVPQPAKKHDNSDYLESFNRRAFLRGLGGNGPDVVATVKLPGGKMVNVSKGSGLLKLTEEINSVSWQLMITEETRELLAVVDKLKVSFTFQVPADGDAWVVAGTKNVRQIVRAVITGMEISAAE